MSEWEERNNVCRIVHKIVSAIFVLVSLILSVE